MCEKKRNLYLLGIGTGSEKMLTVRGREVLDECECVIGADRMLDSVLSAGQKEEKTVLREYRPEKILEWWNEHPEIGSAAVVLSGDTGFYSGAKKIRDVMEKGAADTKTEMIPGISSVVYFAAKLGVSWEDAALISLHGKEGNFVRKIRQNRKTFLLLGGEGTAERFLNGLKEFGMDQVILYAGKRLSYPEEEILTGSPREMTPEQLSGLCVVFAENPDPETKVCPHRKDEEFIRGKVPMTKEEVRAVSIAKLELTEDAVVYDVGAGTGSVSVEAALSGENIRVYAVERNPEAMELLRENRRKFCAEGMRPIFGEAPKALEELERPTHIFIGGSSGNLKEILKTVCGKNPNVRIVINAISLETIREVMEAAEEGLLKEPEITQMSVSKSKTMGRYHMMMGQNPVYIISSGGERREA